MLIIMVARGNESPKQTPPIKTFVGIGVAEREVSHHEKFTPIARG